jgi:rod shape-determining protein MreC
MANGTWRIARTRGSYQLPLVLVFALAIALVLIGKAQSSLFDRARANVTDWMAPGLEVLHQPVVWVTGWTDSIGEAWSVYKENARLKAENARLRQWQNAAIVLDDRVKRYQLLMHAVPDPALSTVMARVIGRATRPFLQTMILDAGKSNGIKPGQAVVDARGMLGRIFLAGERTSWVILLTDLNSRVPVSIMPGNVQAIMAGDNTAAPLLDSMTQGTNLKAGDQVVSSGDGGLLPPGLRIGTVVQDGNGFRVVLLADSASSQDVEVLDFKNPVEQAPAPTPGDLPVTAAGLAPAAPTPAAAGNVVPPQTGTAAPLTHPAPTVTSGAPHSVVAPKGDGSQTANPPANGNE